MSESVHVCDVYSLINPSVWVKFKNITEKVSLNYQQLLYNNNDVLFATTT